MNAVGAARLTYASLAQHAGAVGVGLTNGTNWTRLAVESPAIHVALTVVERLIGARWLTDARAADHPQTVGVGCTIHPRRTGRAIGATAIHITFGRVLIAVFAQRSTDALAVLALETHTVRILETRCHGKALGARAAPTVHVCFGQIPYTIATFWNGAPVHDVARSALAIA